MEKTESDTLQEAYRDRNLAVMALAQICLDNGFKVGLNLNLDDPKWPILFIDLPDGQVSWHLPKDEIIGSWPTYYGPWDGHSLIEKQGRIEAFIRHYAPGVLIANSS